MNVSKWGVTPEIVSRVDAWVYANIRTMARESDNFAFELHYAWRDARKRWEREAPAMQTSKSAAASCRASSAALRGILRELVRWAWDDQLLYAVALDVTPARMRWTVIQPSRNGGVVGMWETEDDALVAALEAAPRRETEA